MWLSDLILCKICCGIGIKKTAIHDCLRIRFVVRFTLENFFIFWCLLPPDVLLYLVKFTRAVLTQ